MASGRYLTKNEEESLVRFVAAKGENYERYLEWCEAEKIPEERRYTPGSFHNRVNKVRLRINSEKAEIQDLARDAAVMTKERRVTRLQRQLDRIEGMLMDATSEDYTHECEGCGKTHFDLNVIAKMEDQYRKTLESIARELGEWGKLEVPSPTEDTPPLQNAVARIAQAMELRRISEAKVVSQP